ncbi:zinc ABC transporter substrate-binding protein ZnuA [Ciceribacter sp. RN22]|uniref:zinc ABC transporter substrate-binding protein ZnuA n=1 Tax=Ciceribacter sp. RN22 TaxID=2954932 RepID=UPI0020935409|nr:zinc ABC transporter substrate-binding protein ZnuA [Ciceribacter sp. RN22]MCO6178182.1 zinc ABC transporter substrate-binding protein ZnuA [Ciceribacter sp. RN22]
MNQSLFRAAASVAALLVMPSLAAAEVRVVASVKPVHSLVAAIMQGVGEPALIVGGAASPHTYSLKPSDAQKLEDADVVFWIGHDFEAFLDKPLEALPGDAKVVALSDAPGLVKLPFREGGPFEAHDDGDHEDHAAEVGSEAEHHDEHEHGGTDMHLWLDPMNAKAMAAEIRDTLVAADPTNADAYRKNAEVLDNQIDALDREIAATIAPVKDKPFVVFHDAYQYFENRYHVRVAGSVTVSPETMPGAERLSAIHAKIGELGAACVFAEPQFEPKLLNVVTEGTAAKSGVLDPAGGALAEGPALYGDLLRAMATSLVACLSM